LAHDRLSSDADHDLTDIYHYGRDEFGELAADTFLKNLRSFITKAAEFPHLGTSLNDVHPGLRFRVFEKHYLILYLPRPYGIFVLRIVRAERLLRPQLLSNAIEEASQE